MLAVLRIKNFAIIEEVEIEFNPGMNVLTGETGAGKSIILKSLELISGKRASSEIVRSGTQAAEMEALFVLSDSSKTEILEVAEELEDTLRDNELLIRRIVDTGGRSKVYLNGKLSTASVLQNISLPLLDITSQHQQQSLLNPSNHQKMLDAFGIKEELLEEVREKFLIYAEKRNTYKRFIEESEEQKIYFEKIEEEEKELSSANLRENERQELEDELKRLSNFEEIAENISSAQEILDSGLSDLFQKLEMLTENAFRLDPKLEEIKELVNGASVQSSEAGLALSTYAASLNAEPERLEEIRERIAEIARLERKYKRKLPELIAYHAKIASEIELLGSGAFDEKKLKEELQKAEVSLREVEKRLTSERISQGKKLAKEVEKGLSSLKMQNARFFVKIEEKESSVNGADKIEFQLAANPGEPERSLNKVASGGELSRILLVLKTIMNQELSPSTQIFDEVDTGIGGAVAEIVGEKLKKVSKTSQVILVTHAPQIAAQASSHFFISKSSENKNTRTAVRLLEKEERVKQIAEMLAGRNISAEFEDSAKQLLGFS